MPSRIKKKAAQPRKTAAKPRRDSGINKPDSQRAGLLKFCRTLPAATEDIKWQKDLVFSVCGKMFACFDARGGDQVSFKTTPGSFALLTRQPGIFPAPYAARFHWILVKPEAEMPQSSLRDLIRESYQRVRDGLPKKLQARLFGKMPDQE